ncbi:MAG: PSD1 and planctomycete cytochrome C domain-containing protein [Planctomycetia bacterium]|nr:PSD1 and planctomycete cytochrome C domain-containing protein [Planctomycetia bacterium]
MNARRTSILVALSVLAALAAVVPGIGISFAETPPTPAPATTPVKPALPADHAAQMQQGLDLFKDQVRPVLMKSCVHCHGGKVTESEFDLTTREGLLKGGAEGKAKTVIPGDAAHSRLYQLIKHVAEPTMPQEAAKLTDGQIANVARWIDLGAPYDKPLVDKGKSAVSWTETVVPEAAKAYWAFKPLTHPALPDVKSTAWVRTPLDRFILARLEAKSLRPNEAAEKRILIRRATFDLTGLPPTPAEIDAFVQDNSPDAYEKLIDRLLASPHYGERWARHWLDVARFAESFGFEHDYDRKNAFHYRDFVIRALNQDMPYDQFVRWQLAGDELAPGDPLAMMATGFLGAGVFPTQITANEVERTRYDALDDMTATTGVAFLGMTVGCARCHDHKFDPIPQADYYRMLATFTTAVRGEVDLAADSADLERMAKFERERSRLAEKLAQYEAKELPGRFDVWLASQSNKSDAEPSAAAWTVLDVSESKSQGGTQFTKQPDGSLVAGGKSPAMEEYAFVATSKLKGIKAFRLEAMTNDGLVRRGPGRAANGNFCLTDLHVTVAPTNDTKPAQDATLLNPRATFQQPGLPIAAAIDADATSGWAVDLGGIGHDQAAAFDFAKPIGFDGGTVLTFRLRFQNNAQHSLGRLRLSVSTAASPALGNDSSSDPKSRLLAQIKAAGGVQGLDAAQRSKLIESYRELDPTWNQLHQELVRFEAQRPKAKTTKVMVVSEGITPIRLHTQGVDFLPETHFLRRGDSNQKEGVAAPGFLQVLMPASQRVEHWRVAPPAGAKTSYRRATLARWITDADEGAGQQAARVMVNRLWQHHFGRGLVATVNDFGKQGDRPTHPELLDYLAGRLIAEGWKLKPLHKLIMTSAVYRQSSQVDAARVAADPQNELWGQYPLSRLDAEVIRDSILAVSGRLNPAMYGPGTLDGMSNRRSIYFTVKRSQMIPMMQMFDAPEALSSQGARSTTTVAPQALLLINSPLVRACAQDFAGQLAAAAEKSPEDAVRQGFRVAVGRLPTDKEVTECAAFIKSQADSYQKTNQKDAKRQALADFCQALLALNEFVYVE